MTARTAHLVTSTLIALTLPGCFLIQPIDEAEVDAGMTSPDMSPTMDMPAIQDMRPDLDMSVEEMHSPVDTAPDLDMRAPAAALSIYTKQSGGLRTPVDATLELHVDALDSNGVTTTCSPTWEVSPPEYGTISADGVLSPINTGALTVIAQCDGVRAMASVESTLPEITTSGVELVTWLVADRGIERDRDFVTVWGHAYDEIKFAPLKDEWRPLYLERVPEINDFPAVDFSDDYLHRDMPLELTDELTIITVLRGTKSGEINHIAGWCNNASLPDAGNHLLIFDPSGNYELNSKATIEGNGINDRSEYSMTTSPSIWHVRSLIVSAQNVTFHEDGELIKEQAPRDVPLRYRMSNLGGWCSSSGNRFTGQMAEMFFFQGALSATEREAIESYLLQKYDL